MPLESTKSKAMSKTFLMPISSFTPKWDSHVILTKSVIRNSFGNARKLFRSIKNHHVYVVVDNGGVPVLCLLTCASLVATPIDFVATTVQTLFIFDYYF